MGELNKMKKSMAYGTVDEIEKRIATVEFKMWTESLSLKEEKAYQAEVKDLKKQKSKLAELDQLKGKVEGMKQVGGGDLREKSKALAEMMQTLYQKKTTIQERRKKMMEEHRAEMGDIGGDKEKRGKIQEKIQVLIKERSELKEAFRAE